VCIGVFDYWVSFDGNADATCSCCKKIARPTAAKKKKKKKNCYSLHPDILAFGVQNFAQNTSI
jgi:hypothetical protein